MEPNILIKTALSSAVEYITNGDNPTEALKKAADDFDLNEHYIQRVGEALNTALHYNHFKNASDRAANFPIADIPKAIKEYYNPVEKQSQDFFSNAELHEKLPDFNNLLHNRQHKLATVALIPKEEIKEKLPTTIYKRAFAYVDKLEKQADDLKGKTIEAENQMGALFYKLANHFKKSNQARTSFEEFESQAYSAYGEQAVPYLDNIYKAAGIKEDRGQHDDKYILFSPCLELSMFETFTKAAAEWLEMEKISNEVTELYKEEKESLQNVFKGAEAVKEWNTKISANIDKLFDMLKEHVLEENKNEDKSPKKLDNTLDNLQRQTVLQDLIIRDPVLKNYPPKEVISAYEQILRISPQTAKEREVVRALLRQIVAGQSVGPHVANSLAELDMNMLKQRHQNRFGIHAGGK